MSGYRLPHPVGAWLDRSESLEFTFNGKTVSAFAGDTVASALIAQGVVQVGRSYKLHRPRGIFTCGVEEPTGLLDVGLGPTCTPNTRATDIAAKAGLVTRTGNAWPSLSFDLAAVNSKFAALMPAGFYYKTFMWPHWHLFEPTIRRMAGLGFAADAADPDRYDEVSRSVDVLVVGGGHAGMQAAIAAARSGSQVVLLEGSVQVGGWVISQPDQLADATSRWLQELTAAGVEVLTRTTAFGIYDHRLVGAVQTIDRAGMRERILRIRANRIILATGAFERPMLFPDNDRPGVMLAGAVQRYATHYGVACGRRVVIAAACDTAYAAAVALERAGVHVAAIVDQRPESASRTARTNSVAPVHFGSTIVAVRGTKAVHQVSVASDTGDIVQIEADCIASAGGWTPAVNLYSMAGGKLRWVQEASMFVPDRRLDAIDCVGACAGAFDLDAAMEHAEAVGRNIARATPVGGLGLVPANNSPSDVALATLGRSPGKTFVDLQNDVSASDVALAARENYRSVEHLKRYTTMGMATDQGKTSNINALVLMGSHTGRAPAEVGTTKFRPPFKPVTLNALAAGRGGERLRPLKRMPGHDWHLTHGPQMEEFGGWLRPAAYPRAGESLVAAARREALHVRTHVGLFEGSPLGKIEIFGPDAAGFLDLMYVGTMSSLAIGQARYGLLVDETGVIFDDGIVARLADNHFWVNTTSGGVERVALAFEEWRQCEFVTHRVLITPVTSSWGNVTVAGPKAWSLLEAAGFDSSLAPGAMKHMSMRQITYGGVAMRVLRASFSGELGYEINLPALRTQALFDRLSEAGKPYQARPYGVEALNVMRIEKGFIHLGSDTDGTTNPADVGLDRAIAKKVANFVGRRSLLRPSDTDPHRMQLVGLLPIDGRTVPPVGAHIAKQAPPAAIEGYVTSSCESPVLGHPIALAMLSAGNSRIGERISAFHMGKPIPVEVVKTAFFDPQGTRLNGGQ